MAVAAHGGDASPERALQRPPQTSVEESQLLVDRTEIPFEFGVMGIVQGVARPPHPLPQASGDRIPASDRLVDSRPPIFGFGHPRLPRQTLVEPGDGDRERRPDVMRPRMTGRIERPDDFLRVDRRRR
ncbi:hypothetical protein AMJ57_01900 [Parcubacteria bacterium SG8_24]|nr:MAG: hypothetical protein AMJ57_01900 [Parcubacteria bacterium SG8_24]